MFEACRTYEGENGVNWTVIAPPVVTQSGTVIMMVRNLYYNYIAIASPGSSVATVYMDDGSIEKMTDKEVS